MHGVSDGLGPLFGSIALYGSRPSDSKALKQVPRLGFMIWQWHESRATPKSPADLGDWMNGLLMMGNKLPSASCASGPEQLIAYKAARFGRSGTRIWHLGLQFQRWPIGLTSLFGANGQLTGTSILYSGSPIISFLGDPAHGACQGEDSSEQLDGDTNGALDDAGVEVDVRVQLAGDTK